jgi:hypothetical protein
MILKTFAVIQKLIEIFQVRMGNIVLLPGFEKDRDIKDW